MICMDHCNSCSETLYILGGPYFSVTAKKNDVDWIYFYCRLLNLSRVGGRDVAGLHQHAALTVYKASLHRR